MFELKSKRQKEGMLVCNSILGYFGVKYTRMRVSALLEEHADYPSLLSLQDVFNEYGVSNTAIRKGEFSYEDVETPYISVVQQEDWSSAGFTVVTQAENGRVTYLDPITEVKKTVSLAEFEKIDKGILLLIDGEHAKDESNYLANRSQENRVKALSTLPLLLAALFLVIPLVYLFSASVYESTRWISFAFLVNGLVGVATSALLLWHDIDAHNPFLKEVCGGQGKKMNCGAVLNSKGASFIGISWSVWGFAYFSSFFLIQLLYPGLDAQLSLWSIISLLVSPYILYSIYYQWLVVKQWCPLCLTVQFVLLLNATTSLIFLANNALLQWEWYTISITILSGISFLILGHFAIPLLKQSKDSRNYERKWKKLRYNSDVFQALLQKSESITVPVDGIGIVVGNPEAKQEIIKVCNPYCGPCSDAHPALEQIIRHNSDIRLRIIFTANGEESDIKTAPVAHLLAIEQVYGTEVIYQALDDWYLAERKDYEAFAKKYPMNGELKQQKEKTKNMHKWCHDMKIRATPTIYINGKELPDGYRISELKNIL